jgi:hypothetical protein
LNIEYYITNAERIGIQKDIELKAREVALSLLRKGMDSGSISEVTGLSVEQIQKNQAEEMPDR